jgi:hypothetical protein
MVTTNTTHLKDTPPVRMMIDCSDRTRTDTLQPWRSLRPTAPKGVVSDWSVMDSRNLQAYSVVGRLALARHTLSPALHVQMVDCERTNTNRLTPRSIVFIAPASNIVPMQYVVATATRKSPEWASRKMAATSAGYFQKLGNDQRRQRFLYMDLWGMLLLVVLSVCKTGHVLNQRSTIIATLRTQLPYLHDIPFRPFYLLCRKGAACMTQAFDRDVASRRITQCLGQVDRSHCHGATPPGATRTRTTKLWLSVQRLSSRRTPSPNRSSQIWKAQGISSSVGLTCVAECSS